MRIENRCRARIAIRGEYNKRGRQIRFAAPVIIDHP
jgi:hypothetical protein